MNMLRKAYYRLSPSKGFPGSKAYWEQRYKAGGTSGSGSYNRLALFKAEVINAFVKENRIDSVIEFGCGDGNQLQLGEYPRYTGVDVATKAIEICRQKFQQDTTKEFVLYDNFEKNKQKFVSDLSLSLDVIYHLIEDAVFEKYMHDLFDTASRFVIIYSSDKDGEQTYHERDRKFTAWVQQQIKGWELVKKIPNRYPEDVNNPDETSKADFFIYRKVG